ncbi:hypothetical protein [Paludibacterium paludis]|uniref:Uncharacterized protein n=1 Tax=Paludibacterium paludis TaxID=1225769 RepID=A0A918NXI7_9NEIS|nr:hypothetical protein [Paludibacterium paludis]GGY05046.1 hypothetical protein GCM10011289_04510 [Paludibacterium paludis]
MHVVCRTFEQLDALAPDERPAPRPDRSVIVPAMAEYIRFTGKQIGMPTLRFDGRREWLSDGAQLILALRLAGRAAPVYCLRHGAPPDEGEPFGPDWAQRTGSDARLITFAAPPDDAQREVLHGAWPVPPQPVSELSWGWNETDASTLPDWLAWLRSVAAQRPGLPPVAAVNGRRAVFPPP